MKLITVFALLVLATSLPQPARSQQGIKPSFNHFAIYIHDLAKSNIFYKTVMKLDTIPEPFKDGKHTWFKIGEHSQLHVIQGAGETTTHDKNSHLSFTVASVDSFMVHLRKLKIGFSNSAGENNVYTIRKDGIRQIYLQDPDGYWIEINDDKF